MYIVLAVTFEFLNCIVLFCFCFVFRCFFIPVRSADLHEMSPRYVASHQRLHWFPMNPSATPFNIS